MPQEVERYLRAMLFAAFATVSILLWIEPGRDGFLQLSLLTFFLLWIGAMFLLPWQGIVDALTDLKELLRRISERWHHGRHSEPPD